jgi:F0F1-type ATP synthase epsilon subunit
MIIETEVTSVKFPAHDGLVGILIYRAPLLTKLGSGRLTLNTTNEGEKTYQIRGGYAQMKDNVLTILTDDAIAL